MRISSTIKKTIRSARLKQIRRLHFFITFLHRSPRMVSLMRTARKWYVPRKIFEHLVGYRRIFDSLAEARVVAARHLDASHDCLDNINRQISLSRSARPSDYPVLFHLGRVWPGVSSLFDLGGNVGNLFYSYSKYLRFPQDFVWTVYDIERTLELGRQLARERGEQRLRFTDDLRALDGHDVLLVSGSLHYFESPLPDVLRRFASKPSHVVINRIPMTTVKSVVTVQDSGAALFPCKTILRQELISGMEDVGYTLVDQWSVPELSVHIPFYPEYSVSQYSGLYFRLGSADQDRLAALRESDTMSEPAPDPGRSTA